MMDHINSGGDGEEEEDGDNKVCFDYHFVVVVDVDDCGSISGVGGVKNNEEEGDDSCVDHQGEYAAELQDGCYPCFSLCFHRDHFFGDQGRCLVRGCGRV